MKYFEITVQDLKQAFKAYALKTTGYASNHQIERQWEQFYAEFKDKCSITVKET